MIRLVASDIDGTLIGENNYLPANNLEAIHAMEKSNIDFTICTGKTYSMMKNFCKNLQASYGIFGNGNQIINLKTGEEIYRKFLSFEDISFCLSLAQKQNLHVHFYTENEVITSKLMYMDLRNFKLKNSSIYQSNLEFKIVPHLQNYLEENHPEIFKLVISSSSSLSSLKESLEASTNLSICHIKKYKDYKDKIINKEYEYLDITPEGTNKNDALTILENYLNLKPSETMAIGDNLNDIDMIKNSGIGIAVANAYDEVKKVANYTTAQSVEQGGFAEAVYKYISF